jgi:site-specific DNA-adenine methylase
MKHQIYRKYIIDDIHPRWVKFYIETKSNPKEIRKQIKTIFNEFLESIPTRIQMLQLVFPDIKLDYSRESLVQIQERLWDMVEGDENGKVDRFGRLEISSIIRSYFI